MTSLPEEPLHAKRLPSPEPVKQVFPTKTEQNYETNFAAPTLPFVPLTFLPFNVQNLTTLKPVVTNSVSFFHAIEVILALSTGLVVTRRLACHSWIARELSSS